MADQSAKGRAEAFRAAFRDFDQDNNGYITVDELYQVVTSLGDEVADEELRALIREVDVDGDGRVNIEEFIKMMSE